MNINELLIRTLSSHGPVYPDYYDGDEEKYLTFNYPDENPTVFGNNKALKKTVDIQVHLYLPIVSEYQEEKEQICRELQRAGFKYPRVTILVERDVHLRHITFETKINCNVKQEE